MDNAFLPVMLAMVTLMAFGLLKLNLHLGRPHRFYRGFNNLRLSPVSREIAGVSLFFMGLSGYGLFSLFDNTITQWMSNAASILAVAGGVIGFYYMYKLYRIPARPFWDHWQTGTAFLGTALALGALLLAVTSAVMSGAENKFISVLSLIMLCGLLLEGIGLIAHAQSMKQAKNEGAVSHFDQTTKFGKSYNLRNILLATNLALTVYIYFNGITHIDSQIVFAVLTISLLISAVIGRALFYVLVIPTTMPGAFFWRNKGFEEHARETGLAAMPQAGVLPGKH